MAEYIRTKTADLSVSKILGVELEQLGNLEALDSTKEILEAAIAQSSYLLKESSNQRPLQIRWNLSSEIDLAIIKTSCPDGYAAFAKYLIAAAKVVAELNS